MKKIMLTALVAVIVVVQVNAQVAFGAKAGLNVANLSGDIIDTEALVGFHVGVFAEVELSENFIFQPELIYSSQGAKFSEGDISMDFELNYINLPIMFKYGVADGFYLEAGPQIGFLTSAKVLGVDIKDEVESIDFGVNLGLSYDISEKFFGGARYNIGLSRISKDTEDESVKNSVLSFSVGYRF